MPAEKARLIDLATLIAYSFRGESFHGNAVRFFDKAESDGLKLFVPEVVTLEAESLFLAHKVDVALKDWTFFISSILENPGLVKIPITGKIFSEHIMLYRGYGGTHTYFDSYHGATARILKIPLVTTDNSLLKDKAIPTEDLRGY